MADLVAGGPVSTASDNGATAPRRPTAGPAPTGSPSGIRSPRDIMRERAAREARQKAEAQKLALEKSRAEQEARLSEEERRRQVRRSAGVATAQGSGADIQQQLAQGPQGRVQLVQDPDTPAIAETQQQEQQTPRIPQSPIHVAPQARSRTQQQATTNLASAPTVTEPAAAPTEPAKVRSSFPHAFERWETLSAHWEGLTSYWLRKLEQNKADINRDALSQQLARQVTDLSAAGANLFHAVVELQRLRASSERKFQRWFFETRTELERAQEVNALLEKALEKERSEHADAVRDVVDRERGSSKVQKQLAEMRRELAISKEEARRAWEELGRREQEERDRTLSLQTGQVTTIGGVQVVPMVHGGGGFTGRAGGPRDVEAQHADYAPGYAAAHPQAPPPVTSPPAAGPSGAYHGPQEVSQRSHVAGVGSLEGGFSEGEYLVDAAGNFVLDAQGHRMAIAGATPSAASVSDDAEADDYDSPPTTNPPSRGFEPRSTPPTGDDSSKRAGAYSDPQDYSGHGYGAPGWETMPRHHHPTRLSDVIEEEDERSRTSASQGHSRGA